MKIFKSHFCIILHKKDLAIAEQAAIARTKENISSGRRSGYKKLMTTHGPGAIGEYCVAKFYNLLWEGKFYEGKDWEKRSLNKENDVKGLEVKSSFDYDNICLELNDPTLFPKVPFISVKLVQLKPDVVGAYLAGWIYGEEALELGSIRSNRYSGKQFRLVYKSKLRPMETLPTQI